MTFLIRTNRNKVFVLFLCVILLLLAISCGAENPTETNRQAVSAGGSTLSTDDPNNVEVSDVSDFDVCSEANPYVLASEVLAMSSSWMEATEYTITDIEHAELSDAEAQYALDRYQDDPPFLLEVTPGKVWRGSEIGRLFVRSSVGQDTRRALERGSTVLIGTLPLRPNAPIDRGNVIEFRDKDQVMMLGSCEGYVAEQLELYLDNNSPLPELEAYGKGAVGLARALAEGNENIVSQFAQWITSYWEQQQQGDQIEDWPDGITPLNDSSPPELLARLNSARWWLDVGPNLPGSEAWGICPRSIEGESPCISLGVKGPPDSLAFTTFYYLPGESRIEFWIVPKSGDYRDVGFMAAAVDDFTDGAHISVVIHDFDGTQDPPYISAEAHTIDLANLK